MENYIVINGKKTELTEQQLKDLGIKVEEKSVFDRGEKHKHYWFITEDGDIDEDSDDYTSTDDTRYKNANYCQNEELMEQRALHETLYRLLWRFTYQNGWDESLWEDENMSKWSIDYNINDKSFEVCVSYWLKRKEVYFITRAIAERAIEEIIKPFMKENPEFIW